MHPTHVVAAVALGLLAVGAAVGALRHASIGYGLVRDGMASQPRVMAGMVWTLTLVALGGLGGVTGGFLQLLEMARR